RRDERRWLSLAESGDSRLSGGRIVRGERSWMDHPAGGGALSKLSLALFHAAPVGGRAFGHRAPEAPARRVPGFRSPLRLHPGSEPGGGAGSARAQCVVLSSALDL